MKYEKASPEKEQKRYINMESYKYPIEEEQSGLMTCEPVSDSWGGYKKQKK